jgi:hypothetical protein
MADAYFRYSLTFVTWLGFAAMAPPVLADLHAELVGAWHGPIYLNGREVYTTIDYRPDGSLSAQIEYGDDESRFKFRERLFGTWEIRDGQLFTVTHSNEGMIEKKNQEIVAITKSLLILRDREGHISIERR